MSTISILEPIVSVEWLHNHLQAENLLVFDASIPKVTEDNNTSYEKQIPGTQFFDLKKNFSEPDSPFPNTIPGQKQFQDEARKLGVNKDSAIVVYDDKGIYSSARVWWLFKTFGFNNVAVLNGGLPEWIAKGFKTENKQEHKKASGNFEAHFNQNNVVYFDALESISKDSNYTILDARSEARFNCKVPEPRAGLRSGIIPNSKNLPFEACLENNKLKSTSDLKSIFENLNLKDNTLIFSCGSGLTACILDLAATVAGYESLKVYDGSWTEYGSLTD